MTDSQLREAYILITLLVMNHKATSYGFDSGTILLMKISC